jgi:hypothetical protein
VLSATAQRTECIFEEANRLQRALLWYELWQARQPASNGVEPGAEDLTEKGWAKFEQLAATAPPMGVGISSGYASHCFEHF